MVLREWARKILPYRYQVVLSQLYGLVRFFARDVRHLGLLATLTLLRSDFSFLWNYFLGGVRARDTARLRLKGHHHDFFYRQNSSDSWVIRQVFSEQQYGPLGGMHDPAVIVDCGANIGCAAVFFLMKYPSARLIAIEPDQANCDICRRNLRPFGARATVLRAAVWPSDAPLALERGVFRDGLEWSHQVRPCRPTEAAEVSGITLDKLMGQFGLERIDLLKVDIERGEWELFSDGCQSWLPRVRNIAIELHDAACAARFLEALSRYRYELTRQGEVTICRGIELPRLSPLP